MMKYVDIFNNKLNTFFEWFESLKFWSQGIQDSFIASFYWAILISFLSYSIYYILYKKKNYYLIKKFNNLKISKNILNGVYYSDYFYKWSIVEEKYKEEIKDNINKLLTLNKNINNTDINLLITLLRTYQSKPLVEAKVCINRIISNNILENDHTNILNKILKLIKRKKKEEVCINEVIEIIVIGSKIYGFNLPNNFNSFKKIRKNTRNQNSPILIKEQKEEFRLMGELFDNHLYVGYWVDPVKGKHKSGSFTFIKQDASQHIEGKWLGNDDKSGIPINDGKWNLERKYDSPEEYYKEIKLCQQ